MPEWLPITEVNVSARTKEAVLKMVGTGTISADRLEADAVQCKILGRFDRMLAVAETECEGNRFDKMYIICDPQ